MNLSFVYWTVLSHSLFLKGVDFVNCSFMQYIRQLLDEVFLWYPE